MPTFLGGFVHATMPKAEGGLGMGRKEAIAYAEQLLFQTQGASDKMFQSEFGRASGGWMRLFNLFKSFVNALGDRTIGRYKSYRAGTLSGRDLAYHLFMDFAVAPAMWTTYAAVITGTMFRGEDEEDKVQAIYSRIAQDSLSFAASGFPFLSEAMSGFLMGVDGMSMSYSPPAMRAANEAYQASQSLGNLVVDLDDPNAWWSATKRAAAVLSTVTRIPVAPVLNRAAKGMEQNEQLDDNFAVELMRLLVPADGVR
jgi:hypothetical protein